MQRGVTWVEQGKIRWEREGAKCQQSARGRGGGDDLDRRDDEIYYIKYRNILLPLADCNSMKKYLFGGNCIYSTLN